MGWKRPNAVWMINVVVLALWVLTAAADRIQSFTDSRGVIHITNLNGAKRQPETPGGQTDPTHPEAVPPSQAITSQTATCVPSKSGIRDKRYKMNRLSITADVEDNAEEVLQEERR